MQFAKYHGLGNDFLVMDLRGGGREPSPDEVRALCDRRFGVGGDGVLTVLAADGADARMRVLNADGSEAEMCGNGIRCVAKHLYDGGLKKDVIHIATGAGVLACGIEAANGRVDRVAVEMGRPRLLRREIPMTGPPDERCIEEAFDDLRVTAVSMGNPHAVAFVAETGAALRARAERVGPRLETHAAFPRKTNAELAHVHDDGTIELVVWERGCGITLACGTGACATATAACLTGRAALGRDLTVRLLGGPLTIHVAADLSGVRMTGPATLVFTGAV